MGNNIELRMATIYVTPPLQQPWVWIAASALFAVVMAVLLILIFKKSKPSSSPPAV